MYLIPLFLIVFFIVISIVLSKNDKPIFRGWKKFDKGAMGENLVAKVLGNTVENEKYVFNDVLFEVKGNSCQIDHILINSAGVFVFETKNYSGRIWGTAESQKWFQTMPNGEKNGFYNPVKQNAKHVCRLQYILKSSYPIHPYVIFIQNNSPAVENVIDFYALKRIISEKENKLSKEEIVHAKNLIQKAIENCSVTKDQHVDSIHERNEKINSGICPSCGGILVERHGKYGNFIGCSNYPKCKFKMNIDEDKNKSA